MDDKTKWNTGDYTKQNEEVVFIGTGLNEKSVTHNIYDMAGNLWEITTEWSIQDNKRILARGGSGNNYNTLSPMARSQNMPDIHMFNDAGFRVVLYLK